MFVSISALADRIRKQNPSNGYVAFHAKRYPTLISVLSSYFTSSKLEVLDIGYSQLSGLLNDTFGVTVDSLGLEPDHRIGTGTYYHFDLDDVQHPISWRKDLPKYDVVVAAEVMEHLHTSSTWVLGFLRTLMKQFGVLVLQTPNAVVLHKRLVMLAGRNSFELIREDATNPRHFREYTLKEIKSYAKIVGLIIDKAFFANYFDYRYLAHGRRGRLGLVFLNLVYDIVPPTLKPGITVVLKQSLSQ